MTFETIKPLALQGGLAPSLTSYFQQGIPTKTIQNLPLAQQPFPATNGFATARPNNNLIYPTAGSALARFAADMKAIAAWPVISKFPVWNLPRDVKIYNKGPLTLKSFVDINPNYAGLPNGRHDDKIGFQAGLPTRLAETKNGTTTARVGRTEIKAWYHQRGFAHPGRVGQSDALVLSALNLDTPRTVDERTQKALIDIKRDWIATPEWRELKKELTTAVKAASEGYRGKAEMALRRANEKAKAITGRELRGDIVADIKFEAEMRSDAVTRAFEDLETNSRREEDLQNLRAPLKGFEPTLAGGIKAKPGSYPQITNQTPLRAIPDNIAGDLAAGGALDLDAWVREMNAAARGEPSTGATLGNSRPPFVHKKIKIIDKGTIFGTSNIESIQGGRNTADFWSQRPVKPVQFNPMTAEERAAMRAILGRTPSWADGGPSHETTTPETEIRVTASTSTSTDTGGDSGETIVVSDPETGTTIGVSTKTLSQVISRTSLDVFANGKNAQANLTTVITNLARTITVMLMQDNRPKAVNPNDATAAKPLGNLRPEDATFTQLFAVIVTALQLIARKGITAVGKAIDEAAAQKGNDTPSDFPRGIRWL